MVTVLQSSGKFWRWALASSFGLAQNGLAYTMLIRLDLSSKFTSPTSTLGPVAILAAEGMKSYGGSSQPSVQLLLMVLGKLISLLTVRPEEG